MNGNLQLIHTNGKNEDFILLCNELDLFLNKLVGGEEKRSQYIPYNQLNEIFDVILAYDGNTPVGCAGFKKYDTECAEVKRVFVRQEYRGKGVSKMLMDLLEQLAKQKGYRYLVLESGELLVAAMGLYYQIGYEAIPNYGQYKDMPESICLKKKI